MLTPCIYLAIPCFNEEEVLPISTPILLKIMQNLIDSGKISATSRILFINDGSKDHTWDVLNDLYNQNTLVEAVSLSRNRGHQNALHAGLMTAARFADAVISMDVDLQDDPKVIAEMIDRFIQGYEVVYGVRCSRETDSFFKRHTALAFYHLQQRLGAEIIDNHADCRLLSRRVINALAEYPERFLYLRGLIPLIGFKSTIVYYERHSRMAGESKYPLRAMLRLAKNGLLDFSDKLLSWILPVGAVGLGGSIVGLLVSLICHCCGRQVNPFVWLGLFIAFCTGLLLTALGMLGEYVGRLYVEVKKRPRYFISDFLSHPSEDASKVI
ncbi:glycosyltransferase family 2 protein [Mageeibacillus indolicus]|uniref:Glycosyltransferase, group 2 family protein n=1 Tax=Mageeibacillus indolicus (strain UPII9-5) TaxID=699246 RepID=D3QZ12_MAGIU|nr:glycosyltransferase family 2 protein [Mageeibacillus indolicus]ADC90898.1 glycosyltransferase, group 2 family protein [Mageeibacillus indolicus UPII9-5]KFA56920.1 hypothetical protein HMPREF1632_07320 [Mageeibacillus indolicus 0009-5]